jgi:hypothetical protein
MKYGAGSVLFEWQCTCGSGRWLTCRFDEAKTFDLRVAAAVGDFLLKNYEENVSHGLDRRLAIVECPRQWSW